MAFPVTLCCSESSGGYISFPDPSLCQVRTAVAIDSILALTLFIVGILAVIGNGTPVGHALHSIGKIGSIGGAFMMVSGVLIAIPSCCCGPFCGACSSGRG